MTLFLCLHVVLYSVFPFYFATLSRGVRAITTYAYIALLLMLASVLGPMYALPLTDSIVVSGSSICFTAFWMVTILLIITESNLDAVRMIIRLVIMSNLFLICVSALIWLVIQSPATLNPLNESSSLYRVSIWILLFGGAVTIAELLLTVWIAERIKLKIEHAVGRASAVVVLFILIICLDGILFPLVATNFDSVQLHSIVGDLSSKLVLALSFSIPMLFYLVVHRDPIQRFLRAPILLSQLFDLRNFAISGEEKYRTVIAGLTTSELRVLAGRLSSAVAAAEMGVWEFDVARETLDWDQRASKIHGVKAAPQSRGVARYWETVVEEDRPGLRRQVSAMLDGELDSFTAMYRLNPQAETEGKAVYVKLHALMDRTEKGGRILGAVSDVSKEVQTAQENELLQTRVLHLQKMESMGRFVGSIAHDFNNLLTPILGYAELGRAQLNVDHPVRQNLEEICDAADRSRLLIQQLLAFDRDPTLERKPIDLSAVIKDSRSIMESLIGASVSLKFDLLDRAMVLANRSQLEQVMLNLAANARDAIRGIGTLKISTGIVDVDEEFLSIHAVQTSGKYIQLSVEDDGVGMDEATMAHIFEPYYTTKEMGKGTGLGMYTTYSIIQQHEGYIWLKSSPAGGTTVSILLEYYVNTPASKS